MRETINMHRFDITRMFVLCVATSAPLANSRAQRETPVPPSDPARCPSCVAWNAPQAPFRIHGNTYYVGTRGLSSILVTSPSGHVLLDGGLPESAPAIAASIRALGFRVEDVKLLLNSHFHFDHAGGLAWLQRASGGRVAASSPAAPVLRSGTTGPDDPQFGLGIGFPRVPVVDVFADGDTLRAGGVRVVAHVMGGHAPGGTSWTWRSCEGQSCLDFVYADSQTPVSADSFYFTRTRTYPQAIADFTRSFAFLELVSCDVLVTPHPSASALFERMKAAGEGKEGLVDPRACQRYAATARKALAARIEREKRP